MRTIDLTGKRYGELVALDRSDNMNGDVSWRCLCDCGATIVVRGRSLRSGRTQSCGCLKNRLLADRKAEKMIGLTSGRLTVTARAANDVGGCARWTCDCSCGAVVTVRSTDLVRGATRSCGCLVADRTREANTRNQVGYRGMHARLRRERGRASLLRCVDCEARADDWSYVGNAPDEVRSVVSGWKVRHSHDLNRYVPRCRPCHNRHDHPSGGVS